MKNVELRARGKEFNEISNETMNIFSSWLRQSNLSENELLEILKKQSRKIEIKCNSYSCGDIAVYLCADEKVIGEPFIYKSANVLSAEIEKEKRQDFYYSVILLLMMIASRGNDDKLYEEMRVEINKKIMSKIE